LDSLRLKAVDIFF